VRCDFNVPLIDGKITDENRIVAALPTLKKLIADGGRLVLCSHLGKPKGPDASATLAPVAERLSQHLGQTVKFLDCDCVVCDDVRKDIDGLKEGEVALLQNTRFRKEEGKNEEAFSKDLASIADIYVNDAFGSAHRAHCSTVGVTKFVSESAVGYLMEKELKFLGGAVNNPERPFVAILGGAKVSDKIPVINEMLGKVDKLIIGGGMAYTFFAAQGYGVGTSLLEKDRIDFAKDMIAKAKEKGIELLLPVDTVVAKEFKIDAEHKTVPSDSIEDGWMGLDIGEKNPRTFFKRHKRRENRNLERPHGCIRIPEFRKGNASTGAGFGRP
jgi:phosphoglycerate kinase